MTLPPAWRKALLVSHVVSSVGWLGAVLAFLALAVAALNSDDATMRALYIAMETLGWAALVPLAFATLGTGVVQSLLTPWGLARHWWVLVKLGLTVIATVVLLTYTGTLESLAEQTAVPGAHAGGHAVGLPSWSPVVHSVGALVVLLGAAVLSVYKPRGLTRRGWRHAQRQQEIARATRATASR